MADVRYTAGTPVASDFGGISTPTPSTPIIVNAAGQMYALLNNTVTLLNSAVSPAETVLVNEIFQRHPQGNPAVVMGNAADVIQGRVFRSGIATGLWG